MKNDGVFGSCLHRSGRREQPDGDLCRWGQRLVENADEPVYTGHIGADAERA